MIQDKLTLGDKERARLVAANSGLHFDEPPNFDQWEVIKILDIDEYSILKIGYIKPEPEAKVEDTPTNMIDFENTLTDMIDSLIPRWANGRRQLMNGNGPWQLVTGCSSCC